MVQLNVTLNVFTRWHAGTGAGGGTEVDALVRRENGHPILAGTMMKGLARDRALVVAEALPHHRGLIESVFGTKRRPAAWYFGTARPDLAKLDQEPTIEISRHNRHDRVSGRVPDDYFFSIETASPMVLLATVEPIWHEPTDVEVAFVAASLMAIDRLGARRQRGWGRCDVTVAVGDRSAHDLLGPLFALPEVAS